MGEHLEEAQLKVAIKLEPSNDRSAQLYNEFKFYRLLGEGPGFPKIYFHGVWNRYNVLVMELLGKNLEDIFELCERNFSLKTIIQVTLQLLDRFEYLHSRK